jgi:hypothetical protein
MPRWLSTIASAFSPRHVQADGQAAVKVVSRFGTLYLDRQVFAPVSDQPHTMPGNAVLPPHLREIITRGLQELACLLPQNLSFASVERLLGWQTQQDQVLSETRVRRLVRTHGLLIGQAEQTEVRALLAREDLATLTPQLIAAQQPRRRAAWPASLSAAVDQALHVASPTPPDGVSFADWERVLCLRREEQDCPLSELRKLGPLLHADQVVATTDEVLTRKMLRRHFNQLHSARVVTTAGSRYLSGTGETFASLLLVLILLCAGQQRLVVLLADAARWIRSFFAVLASVHSHSSMILDWFHLRKRVGELTSMICQGRKAKAALLRPLLRHLWRGEVEQAEALLEAYRRQARNAERLEELIGYLRERQPYIPNYRERRRACEYIGSGHVEKANDLIVAKRQKGAGMHWSIETSDTLAALRTLMLNGGWERYWQHRELLPLVAT